METAGKEASCNSIKTGIRYNLVSVSRVTQSHTWHELCVLLPSLASSITYQFTPLCLFFVVRKSYLNQMAHKELVDLV